MPIAEFLKNFNFSAISKPYSNILKQFFSWGLVGLFDEKNLLSKNPVEHFHSFGYGYYTVQ